MECTVVPDRRHLVLVFNRDGTTRVNTVNLGDDRVIPAQSGIVEDAVRAHPAPIQRGRQVLERHSDIRANHPVPLARIGERADQAPFVLVGKRCGLVDVVARLRCRAVAPRDEEEVPGAGEQC